MTMFGNVYIHKHSRFSQQFLRESLRKQKFSLTFSRKWEYQHIRENVYENETFRYHFRKNFWNTNILRNFGFSQKRQFS